MPATAAYAIYDARPVQLAPAKNCVGGVASVRVASVAVSGIAASLFVACW